MKNKFIVFFLLIAIVTVLVLGIVVFISLWSSVRCPDPGMMKVFGFFDIENDLCFVPAFDTNTEFVVNPYQAGNLDQEGYLRPTGLVEVRDMAVIIGASVSYILREVKYFTLFIVVLMVLALNACSIIVYFVLDKVAKPIVRQEETTMDISDKENGGDNPGYYIEEQASGMTRLSLEIDEMLAEISSVMEKSKLNQRVLVK